MNQLSVYIDKFPMCIDFSAINIISNPSRYFSYNLKLNRYTENVHTIKLFEYIEDKDYLDWLSYPKMKNVSCKMNPTKVLAHLPIKMIKASLTGHLACKLYPTTISIIYNTATSYKLPVFKELFIITKSVVDDIVNKLLEENFDRKTGVNLSINNKIINIKVKKFTDKFIDYIDMNECKGENYNLALNILSIFGNDTNIKLIVKLIYKIYDNRYPNTIPRQFWNQF